MSVYQICVWVLSAVCRAYLVPRLPCGPVDEAEGLRHVGVDSRNLLAAADAPGDDADLDVGLPVIGENPRAWANEGAAAIT